jgi:hypothetical protein
MDNRRINNWQGQHAYGGSTINNGNVDNRVDNRSWSYYNSRPDHDISQAQLDGIFLEGVRDGATTPRLDYLLQRGAIPTTETLQEAVLVGRLQAVEWSLESNKTDVNAVNKDGKTPLALANMLPNGDKKDQILALLRREGATEASSSSGNSAKTHATGRGGTRTQQPQQQQAKTPLNNLQVLLESAYGNPRPEPPVIDYSDAVVGGIEMEPRKTFNHRRGWPDDWYNHRGDEDWE